MAGALKICVPQRWVNASILFGAESSSGYLDGEKDHSLQYDVAGVGLSFLDQAMGRLGECVSCIWGGLDPETALDWGPRAIGGKDVVLFGKRSDVKTTSKRIPILIWPNKKDFLSKNYKADIFIAVGANHWRFPEPGTKHDPVFDLWGWCALDEFLTNHKTARSKQEFPYLRPGTPFLLGEDLHPMEELRPPATAREARVQGRTCEFIIGKKPKPWGHDWSKDDPNLLPNGSRKIG